MPFVPSNFEWEPVGIPLAAGVDLNTRARLVDKGKLLRAENVFFPRDGGPEMRRGHRAHTVLDAQVSLVGSPPDHDQNLYGYGLFDEDSTFSSTISSKSTYPGAGTIKGLAVRDKEILAWDGHRLFSHHNSDNKFSLNYNSTTTFSYLTLASDGGGTDPFELAANSTAYMPTARSSVIGKTFYPQSMSDAADNGTIRVFATVNSDDAAAQVFVYDSVSGSLKFTEILNTADVSYIKLVPVGAYVHVYVSETGGNTLYLYVIHQNDYSTGTPVDLGDVAVFDVEKVTEDLTLVAKCDTTNVVQLTYVNGNGTVNSSYFSAGFLPDLDSALAHKVAVCVHPTTKDICLFWYSTAATTAYGRIYSSTGTALHARTSIANNNSVNHLTCASAYLTDDGESVFHLFLDDDTSSLITYSYKFSGTSAFTQNTRHNVGLASRAFRVGNTAFVFCYYTTTLQTQYLLMDFKLFITGRLEYGTAIASTSTPWLPGVNCVLSDEAWDVYDFHCALMYRLRVVKEQVQPPTVDATFQENSAKFVTLNFMPKLTYAQAGRCTYFPGALLWAYDGRELVEANFIAGPEGYTFTKSNGAGSLGVSSVYRYRVYLCHKNAAGEEIRSLAFLSDEVNMAIGGDTPLNDTVTISGTTIPTNRDDTYFLVYRNENAGTLWYLVSNRDPSSASCPKNDHTSSTWSFTDTLADTAIIDNELDPANNTSWLMPWAAPACEVIAYGKDRLWIAGGEMAPGEVAASRLFSTNEVPSFSPVLSVSVDRENDPIVAISFIADLVYVFRRNNVYLLSGQFSPNIFLGNSILSQLALTEVGATSPYTARVVQGCLFQSAGGFRLLDSSGGLKSIGTAVDSLTGELAGIVVSYVDRNVRFYQTDEQSPVFDYESFEWSTFNLQPQAAITNPLTGLAVLAVGNKLYFEEEDLYTDDSRTYRSYIRTSWLSSALGGFQSIRRIGALGEFYGHCTTTVNVYMNEQVSPVETFTWDSSADLNSSIWGSGTWGSGFWGDSSGTGFAHNDSVWRWVRRLSRQKCNAVSIEISFNSADGLGAVPTVIMLEVGNRNTLDKVPTRTFGG
jgi:hypothetical protein